ncbi:MAG: hypothetical protein NTX86_04415 [Candidatus Dependentiae bacterium]|nr:hypothetical protein [Candidatus Dependentiae bacterium]
MDNHKKLLIITFSIALLVPAPCAIQASDIINTEPTTQSTQEIKPTNNLKGFVLGVLHGAVIGTLTATLGQGLTDITSNKGIALSFIVEPMIRNTLVNSKDLAGNRHELTTKITAWLASWMTYCYLYGQSNKVQAKKHQILLDVMSRDSGLGPIENPLFHMADYDADLIHHY